MFMLSVIAHGNEIYNLLMLISHMYEIIRSYATLSV